MLDGVVHEVEDVCVGDRVEDRLTFAPPFEEARRQQDLQAGRDGVDLFLFEFGELADSDEAARVKRDDAARGYEMMPPTVTE